MEVHISGRYLRMQSSKSLVTLYNSEEKLFKGLQVTD